MLVHGLAKINGFTAMAEVFPNPLGLGSRMSLILAIGAEVGCSLLLIVGFASRLAAIPLAFTMLVAFLVVTGAAEWKVRELAATFLLVYVSLIMTGPGMFSLDHAFFGRRKSQLPAEKDAA